MTGEKRDGADLLASARRAWSPEAADAARVRRALGAALATGAAAPRTAGWGRHLLMAGAIAAASGGAGYWAGHRAGLRATRPSASIPLLAPALAPIAQAPPSPAISPTPALPAPPPTSSHREVARPAQHVAPKPASSPAESLAIEVRALRNTERALRDGQPGLALAFLQELDRAVPKGQLTEERDAAATLARCARGDHPFGVNLADDFAQHHPDSVYRARVEQACTATDSTMTGDSPSRRSDQ
ncbi:MAG TPA: hypothetical protein VHG72_03340 [Polyangia bacterium]|nr:hypothetical protein [Polyangia bacterium]